MGRGGAGRRRLGGSAAAALLALLPLPARVRLGRDAACARRERRRALRPAARRPAGRARPAPGARPPLALPELRGLGPRAGGTRPRSRLLAARQPRADRAALLARRVHPQGGRHVRRAADDGARGVAGGAPREHAPHGPRHERDVWRGLAVRDRRHVLHRRGARALGGGGGRAPEDRAQPLRRAAQRLAALPDGTARPAPRDEDAGARRERRGRPDAALHGAGRREGRPVVGPRRLLLRLPGAVRRRRQGRGRALGVGRVAPRGRRAQGTARGLARQGVPRDLHGHLPPGRARGGLLHDPVVAVRALVPADRRGGGQPGRDPARRVRGDALPARRRFLLLVRRPGTGRHRVDLPPRAGGVHARNALRLPLLRAADVPGRHAHPAADPQRPLARRPDGALRPLGLRRRPPSGRPRGHELPDARHAGEPHVHDVLDSHVPRLPHVARRRGVPARADARRAPRAHEPRALCGRGRPPARPARLELHGLGARVARPGGGGRAAGLPRRRRARIAHEPPLPQRAQGGGGRRRGPG